MSITTYYDLLKCAKTGKASPEMTYYDILRARAAGAASWPEITLTGAPPLSYTAKGQPLTAYTAKGAMTQAAEQQYTLTGVPPLSFSAKGTPLTAYSVTGNMTQASTPTPTQPIVPEECGDRTGNLAPPLSTWETGFIDYATGAVVTTSTTAVNQEKTSPMIRLPESGNYITFSYSGTDGFPAGANGAWRAVGWYDENGDFISRTSSNESSQPSIARKATGAVYCRLSMRTYGNTDEAMLNTGSTALNYEPYGFCIPISVSGTDYPIYLTEPLRKIRDYCDTVDSSGVVTRRIKKVVFDGTENWSIAQSGTEKALFTVSLSNTPISSLDVRRLSICTHYDDAIIYYSTASVGFLPIEDGTIRFRPDNVSSMSKNDWTTWLAQQYAANTPVCVWYVLASPTTELTTAPTITPSAGSNTLSCGTTLAPSSVSLTTVGGVAPYNPIQPAFAGTADGGGYKLTFTNAGNSYPISMTAPLRKAGDVADELSSNGTITRAIKELALTGTENWAESDSGQSTYYALTLSDAAQSAAAVCTDYSYGAATSAWQFDITGGVLRVNKCSFASLTAFKQSLAARAAASNPVKVWYQLANPTTETITAPEIATAKGDNTFTETSTLKPSSVSVTGKIKEATA